MTTPRAAETVGKRQETVEIKKRRESMRKGVKGRGGGRESEVEKRRCDKGDVCLLCSKTFLVNGN